MTSVTVPQMERVSSLTPSVSTLAEMACWSAMNRRESATKGCELTSVGRTTIRPLIRRYRNGRRHAPVCRCLTKSQSQRITEGKAETGAVLRDITHYKEDKQCVLFPRTLT